MKLIPFESYLFRSNVLIEELRPRLEKVIGAPRGLNFLASRPEPYLGKSEKDRFKISRKISNSNSFNPIILGRIVEVGSGTYVHLVLRPSIPVIVFLIFWFGGVAYAMVGMLLSLSAGQLTAYENMFGIIPTLMIPVAFALFGYILLIAGYNLGSRKAISILKDLIKPYRVDDLGIPPINELA